MVENLNKQLYSFELFKIWTEKKGLLDAESYFLNKYLLKKEGNVIEAGTGGGRIIFEIEKLGFKRLSAFDYVESMIDTCNAKKLKISSNVDFKVEDAVNLCSYKTSNFDYIIYLQQVLCFIDKGLLDKALKEALRIGNDSSIYIYSFLNWESKFYNTFLSFCVNSVRYLRNEEVAKYQLPWLKINGKFNWKFLNSNQPKNTWFKKNEISNILNLNGFEILEVKTGKDFKNKNYPNENHLYFACKKTF
jgi:SAM-dependent methyltransferase